MSHDSQYSGGSTSREPDIRRRERMLPVILRGRSRRGHISCRAHSIALPGIDPRPIIFCSSCAPPAARRPGRSRLRPCGASLRRSHDQPCRRTLICGRLGNARGATDSCTKMLPAWGLSPPHLFRPGRSCIGHCGQKGAQDLYRKCCRKPNPPLRGDPQVCPKGKAA